MSFSELPEECIANVLSFTSPKDACRLSAVSPTFWSASESDVVWERFLPEEYKSIISNSNSPSLLETATSKKQVYLNLCDNPIIVENGRKSLSLEKRSGKICYMLSARDLMIKFGDNPRHWAWTSIQSFSLEKRSGKICYMLSARDLVITEGDNPEHWTWNSNPAYRFSEVAQLIHGNLIEIRCKINTSILSAATLYAAYLVFKTDEYAFYAHPVEVTVELDGIKRGGRIFCWKLECAPKCWGKIGGHYSNEIGDGWMEIESDHFFSKGKKHEELEIRVFTGSHYWKCGLIVAGIEFRPIEGK